MVPLRADRQETGGPGVRPPLSSPPPMSVNKAEAGVRFAFLTPRKLPNADTLTGRVVVLDIGFASEGGGSSFAGVTIPFINGLGSRLAAWVDHHDHERHVDFVRDPRFLLCSKAEHLSLIHI